MKETCDKCESYSHVTRPNEAGDLGTCPYQVEINGDDKTLCNCCPECRRDCAMDV